MPFADLDAIARAIEGACPDAAPVGPLAVLGAGYFSVAVETPSGAVFRLGVTPDVVERHDKEARLLPWLAGRGLPVAIPRPRWRIQPGPALPFGALGYPRLPGTPLPENTPPPDVARLARDVARFLVALHSIPLRDLPHLRLDGPDARRRYLERMRANTQPALDAALSPAEAATVRRWWDAYLGDPRMEAFEPVLTHGDVSDENLLLDDDGGLVGVIDWEHAAIGDAASDFPPGRYIGEGFLAQLLEEYERAGGRLDPGVPHRVQRMWELGPFFGIQRAVRLGDTGLLGKGIAALRAHGVLQPEPG